MKSISYGGEPTNVWGGLKTEAKSWLFTFTSITLKETDQRAGWQKLETQFSTIVP